MRCNEWRVCQYQLPQYFCPSKQLQLFVTNDNMIHFMEYGQVKGRQTKHYCIKLTDIDLILCLSHDKWILLISGFMFIECKRFNYYDIIQLICKFILGQ